VILLIEISEKQRCVTLKIKGDKITAQRGLNLLLFRDLFLHKPIVLITIQPQEYSLGFEFLPNEPLQLADTNILVSHITKCTVEIIDSIIESEDYSRGLLLILEYRDQNLTHNYLSFIRVLDFLGDREPQSLKEMLLFTSEDGKTINIYNLLDPEKLISLALECGLEPEVTRTTF
jgi:hypothetical protein